MRIPKHAIAALAFLAASAGFAAGIPEELEQAVRVQDRAVETKDASTWDRMTMPGFIVVRPEGRLMSKAERLAQIETEKAEPRPKPRLEQFIRYGDTVIRQLQEANSTFWIDVWVKDGGTWRVASSQGTRRHPLGPSGPDRCVDRHTYLASNRCTENPGGVLPGPVRA